MQNSNNSRTPSSILRKRAAEEAARKQRQKGRRVSFAPDEDLVTTQLYALDKNSPILQTTGPLGTPLAELQNAAARNAAPAAGMWADRPTQELQLQQLQQGPQGTPMFNKSPAFSPTDMEITNDTLQEGGPVHFSLAGAGSGDTDSINLNSYQAASAKDAADSGNNTDVVPGLSTLVEEDEEADLESEAPTLAQLQQQDREADDDADMETDMELTGATSTMGLPGGAMASTPALTPNGPSPGRRSSRLMQKASPAIASQSPAARRTTRTSTPASAPRPSPRTMHSSVPAPSPGPVDPSPLRRTTRSMAASPLAAAPVALPSPGKPAARGSAQKAVAPSPARRPAAASPATGADIAGAVASPVEFGGRRQVGRGRRSSMGEDALRQQRLWGFVPLSDDDTRLLALSPPAGGLGDTTLHHVYADSAVTGDITSKIRGGALLQGDDADHDAAAQDQDGAEALDAMPQHTPAQQQQQQQQLQQEEQEQEGEEEEQVPADEHAAFGTPSDVMDSPDSALGDDLLMHDAQEGMTTRLLADDRHTWSHVMGQQQPQVTGRGSVGSNALGLTGHLGNTNLLGNTMQLLQEHGGDHSRHHGAPPPGPHDPSHGRTNAPPQRPQAHLQQVSVCPDEPTTRLLADATGSGAITPFARPVALQQQGAADDGDLSPDDDIMQDQQAEPTLELPAMGHGAVTGHSMHRLEDHSIDDFAEPPELATRTQGAQGDGQHQPDVTFTGTLEQAFHAPASEHTNAQRQSRPHSGSLPMPQAQITPSAAQPEPPAPITFQKFLEVVRMQFMDQIRRGTSINLADLAPGPEPKDLSEALKLLTLTSAEMGVLEGAVSELQEALQDKRAGLREQEAALDANNPPLFARVQTASPAELEALLHALALKKRGCRSEIAVCWKRLRADMEQQLGQRLAEQEGELDEHIAFISAQLQRVEQQSAFAVDFDGDVRANMASEGARRREAAAARANLRHMRQRLADLGALNEERQARADRAAAQQQALQARKAVLDADLAATAKKLEELKAAMPSEATPVRSQALADKLADRFQHLDILMGLQAWKFRYEGAGVWSLDYKGLLSCNITVQQHKDNSSCTWADVAVAVAPPCDTVSTLVHTTLTQLAAVAMPHSLSVPAPLLPMYLPPLDARLARAVELAQLLPEALLSWWLLARVEVDGKAVQLLLVFLDPGKEMKATVAVGLLGLLEPRLQAGLDVEVTVQAGGRHNTMTAASITSAIAPITAPGASSCSSKKVLDGLCAAVSRVMLTGAPAVQTQQATDAGGIEIAIVPCGSQTPMARMFSNPLFHEGA